MKKLVLFFCVIALVPWMGNAQTSFISEDFSAPTDSVTVPGWTQNVITGDTAIDQWRFDNPFPRTFNAPITDPAAIFDSDALSNNGINEDVALESPVFDASTATRIILEFDHYFLEGFGGAYDVEVFNGTSWVAVLSGNTSTANPQSESIDISTHVVGVSNAQVRFRWTGSWSFYWIVDNVSVFQPPAADVGIVEILEPVTGCSLGASEPVTVVIENFGSAPQTGFAYGFLVDAGTPQLASYTATIAPGTRDTVTFVQTADVSAPGPHVIGAATGLIGDVDTSNDSLSVTIINQTPVAAPIVEDFETFVPPFGFMNGWTQSTDDDRDWSANTGGTGSTGTGPSGDHTTGSGVYLYTEASFINPGDVFEMTSPVSISAP